MEIPLPQKNKKEFNLEMLLAIFFICMFAVSTLTSLLLYGQNYELSKDLRLMRSALESNPEYLFSKNMSDGVGGRYFLNSGNIALYTKSASPYGVSIDAHHEVGHYIWYEFLNDNLRDNYNSIYDSTNEHISDYAKTEVEEDFAETIAESIIISIDYDKIPEDRREFVRKYVEWYVVT